MVARPCMLDVIWERKGDCVILSRRFSSRIRTLEREGVLGLSASGCSWKLWLHLWTSSSTNTCCLPGDDMQHWEEDDKGPHCHEEPGEDSCDHPHTEEHQDNILDEHLSLERQAHVDCESKSICVSWLADEAQRDPTNPCLRWELLSSTVSAKTNPETSMLYQFLSPNNLSDLSQSGSICKLYVWQGG